MAFTAFPFARLLTHSLLGSANLQTSPLAMLLMISLILVSKVKALMKV